MKKEKLVCPVCGRKFYEGQGVRLFFKSGSETFHSKSCALKFIKVLLEYIETSTLEKAYKSTIEEFKKIRREREKTLEKKI